MSKEIHILYLEDAPGDAVRVENELRKSGLHFHTQRVDTKEAFLRELEQSPDVILSDHGLPAFDGLTALSVSREKCPDVPFIFVTNALTREMEVEKLMGGVTDYVRKNQLDYLSVAVRHALREAEERRLQKQRLKDLFNVPATDETPLLPICASCKKIRDKQNQWKTLESFFLEYLNIHFTHSVCPDCAAKFLSEERPRHPANQA